MAWFHSRCGKSITLLNNNRTAVREDTEFNHGIVLSAQPLVDNVVFEIKIDRKVYAWSGSIEIGVTACDPETVELPPSTASFRSKSWIFSGNSVMKNGQLVTSEFYGFELDKLNEGDRLGIMRTPENELIVLVNGTSQIVVPTDIPPTVHAVVNIYGKCVQVSVADSGDTVEHNNDECMSSETAVDNDLGTASLQSNLSELSLDIRQDWNVNLNLPLENTTSSNGLITKANTAADRLHFHSRRGTLVKLTSSARTAERRRPFDEFNNGVVMTHRSLQDDELFEIRIDRLVDKWSGSIEVGVTTHNPNALEFPATMTNMRSGTIMMSGCGILTNGKGTRREYGQFNLDELREGDRVGMMRKSNGDLHYFINGLDQGVAASKIPQTLWGVIDLYGMTIKVTIVDRDEREEQNLITRRNTILQDQYLNMSDQQYSEVDCYDRLTFHSNCGTHADVINNGRTAHRPNANDDFNNGVVLTARYLKPNEQFEVRLDKIVSKWVGSIEIGVTTHSPTELEFPFTMTNVRSGTWMMTGNGVMHNGTSIIDQYGLNLDRLQVGDRVGVIRKDNGTLHFFINGVDQGPAATNVPEKVYGVIDLYGQAAQATIQDDLDCYTPDTVNSSYSNTTLYSDLRFHHIHGKNARISNNGITASRPRAFAEFNDAIVFSNRPLRDDELFEVTVEKIVDRWTGSIELGMTAMRPEELDLPSTATDLDHDTWMLSGSVVMENGINLKCGYKCDLDKLVVDMKIGVMRRSDGTLHYYIDGQDQGVACRVPRSGLYAVVDLYGQCARVSLSGPNKGPPTAALSPVLSDQPSGVQPIHSDCSHLPHRFSEWHGKCVTLSENNTVATRTKESSHCLVFGSNPLSTDELFEVEILSVAPHYAGSMKIGVTTLNITYPKFYRNIPVSMTSIPTDYWYITGNEVRMKTRILTTNFCPNLEWLRIGDKVGLRRAQDSSLRLIINSEDMGAIANNIPESVFGVIELYGKTMGVHLTSSRCPPPPLATAMSLSMSPLTSLKLQDSLELVLDPPSHGKMDLADGTDAESISEFDRYEFYDNHGRNIEITSGKVTAKRVASYNQGVVIIAKPLVKGQLLEVKIEQLNEGWVSSLMVGVVCVPPNRITFPITALGFKKHCWIVSSDWISINGVKIKSDYGSVLDHLKVGTRVGLLLSESGRLSLYVDGVGLGPLPASLPLTAVYHTVFDLYGQCEQITILNNQTDNMDLLDSKQSIILSSSQHELVEQPSASTSFETGDNQQYEKADLESHEKETNVAVEWDIVEWNDNNCDGTAEITAANNIQNLQDSNQCLVTSMMNSVNALSMSMHINNSRKCEYLKECVKFKNGLFLPDEYFDVNEPICYCSNCYQSCSSDMLLQKGDPPEEYTVPSGFAKFFLRNSQVTNSVKEKWHVAFYGTKLCMVRPILDRGQPFTKDQQKWSNLISLPLEKEESSGSQIEFSPNLEFATADVKYSHVDYHTKNKIEVTTAFQLLVRPGAYSEKQASGVTGSEMTESNSQSGDKAQSSQSVREWCTKETGAIVLNSLLIKLECF